MHLDYMLKIIVYVNDDVTSAFGTQIWYKNLGYLALLLYIYTSIYPPSDYTHQHSTTV